VFRGRQAKDDSIGAAAKNLHFPVRVRKIQTAPAWSVWRIITKLIALILDIIAWPSFAAASWRTPSWVSAASPAARLARPIFPLEQRIMPPPHSRIQHYRIKFGYGTIGAKEI